MAKHILTRNRVTLERNALYTEIRPHLIQDGILTERQIETVDAEKTRHQQISKILDIIASKPDKYAEMLLETLQKADPILYEQIQIPDSHDVTPNEDFCKTSNPDGGVLSTIQAELKDWYIRRLSRFHPIPWCPWFENDLDHVFTNLAVVPGQKHRFTGGLSENTRAKGSSGSVDETRPKNLLDSCLFTEVDGMGSEVDYGFSRDLKSIRSEDVADCGFNRDFKLSSSEDVVDYGFSRDLKSIRSEDVADCGFNRDFKLSSSEDVVDYGFSRDLKLTRLEDVVDYGFNRDFNSSRSEDVDYGFNRDLKSTRSKDVVDYGFNRDFNPTHSEDVVDYGFNRDLKSTRSKDVVDYGFNRDFNPTRSKDVVDYGFNRDFNPTRSKDEVDCGFSRDIQASRARAEEEVDYGHQATRSEDVVDFGFPRNLKATKSEDEVDYVFSTGVFPDIREPYKETESYTRYPTNPLDAEIVLNDVFCPFKGNRFCFVEGPAGIGKSTLCRRLQYTWARDEFTVFGRHFDLVICLAARTLTKDLQSSIAEQQFPEDFVLSNESVYQCLRDNQRNSLLIIDGIDELTPEAKKIVQKLVQGSILRHVNLLLTGRPETKGEIIKHADTHLLLKGFTDDNVEAYIAKYFGQSSKYTDILLSRLWDDDELLEMAHNPFTTTLLCLLAQDNRGRVPTNRSKIYHQVISAVFRKYIGSQTGVPSCTEADLFQAASKLAYTWTSSGVLASLERNVFSAGDHDLLRHVLECGIVTRDFTLSRLQTAENCYFPHRSIQEYLCAWYLSELSARKLAKKLKTFKENPRNNTHVYGFLLALLLCKRKQITPVLKSLSEIVTTKRFSVLQLCELLQDVFRLVFESSVCDTDDLALQTERALCLNAFLFYTASVIDFRQPGKKSLWLKFLNKIKLPPVAICLTEDCYIYGDLNLNGDEVSGSVAEVHPPFRLHSFLCQDISVDSNIHWTCVHYKSPTDAERAIDAGLKISTLGVTAELNPDLDEAELLRSYMLDMPDLMSDLRNLAQSIQSKGRGMDVAVFVKKSELNEHVSQKIATFKVENETDRVRYVFVTSQPCSQDVLDIERVINGSLPEFFHGKFSPY